jgi:hypothetical protein
MTNEFSMRDAPEPPKADPSRRVGVYAKPKPAPAWNICKICLSDSGYVVLGKDKKYAICDFCWHENPQRQECRRTTSMPYLIRPAWMDEGKTSNTTSLDSILNPAPPPIPPTGLHRW